MGNVSAFVRTAAVLVGLANLAVSVRRLFGSADRADDAGDLPAWPFLLLLVLFSVAVGLLVAEVLLRLSRPRLEGGFFGRYVAMVMGCCIGGTLSVVLLTVTIVLYATLSSQDAISAPMTLLLGAYFAVYAGLLGLTEGLFLGLPLTGLLGVFRGGTVAR